MPRKTTPKITPVESGTDSPVGRKSGRSKRKSNQNLEVSTPVVAVDSGRSRRSSTAAQTAASVADSRTPRSRARRSSSASSESNTRSRDASVDSPRSRASSRRVVKQVNYVESDGEEEAKNDVVPEEEYNAEEDLESDSGDSTKDKNKIKVASPNRIRIKPASSRNSRSPKTSGRKGKKDRTNKEEVDTPKPKAAPSRRGRHSKPVSDEDENGAVDEDTSMQIDSPAPKRSSRTSARKRGKYTEPLTDDEEVSDSDKKLKALSKKSKNIDDNDDHDGDEDANDEEIVAKKGTSSRASRAAKRMDELKVTPTRSPRGQKGKNKSTPTVIEEEEEIENDLDKSNNQETKKRPLDVDETENNSSKRLKTDEEMEIESTDKPTVENITDSIVKSKDKVDSGLDEEKMEVEDLPNDLKLTKVEDNADDKKLIVTETIDKINDDGDVPVSYDDKKLKPAEKIDQGEKSNNEALPLDESKNILKSDVLHAETGILGSSSKSASPSKDQQTLVSHKNNKSSSEKKDDDTTDTPVLLCENVPEKNSNKPLKDLEIKALSEETKEELSITPEKSPKDNPVKSLSEKPEVQINSKNKDISSNLSSETELLKSHENLVSNTSDKDCNILTCSEEQVKHLPSNPTSDHQKIICEKTNANGLSDIHLSAEFNNIFHGRKYIINQNISEEQWSQCHDRTFGVVCYNLGGEAPKPLENFVPSIKLLKSELICMQGVNEMFHKGYLESTMDGLGYKGLFSLPEGQTLGFSLFFKGSVKLKMQRSFSLKQAISKELQSSLLPNERESVIDQVSACGDILLSSFELSLPKDQVKTLALANINIPHADLSTHALQMACLAREALTFLDNPSNPLIICGAFNMISTEASYQLLKDGYLSNEMIEILQSRKDIKVPGKEESTALVNLLWKSFQHSATGLKSCYSSVLGKEVPLPLSSEMIWYSSSCLHTVNVLDVLSESKASENSLSFNKHVMLKATLAFAK